MYEYFFEIILGLLAIIFLSILAYKRKNLDIGGAVAAIVLGSIVLVGYGWPGLILMVVFFIFSIFSTHLRYEYKRNLGFAQEKGGERGWRNTLANGGVAAASAIAGFFISRDIFAATFLGAIATAMSDTLATEIGLLSRYRPRLITNLRKKVGAGTSGGISLLGEIIVVCGSLFMGILAFIFKFSTIPTFKLIFIALLGGIAGSHADSILGATIQSMNKCVICGITTESSFHHNKPTKSFKGIKIIGNNAVNFISTFIGALVGVVVLLII
jgi:uncharacterized protein (TIGR00297 family)